MGLFASVKKTKGNGLIREMAGNPADPNRGYTAP